MITRESTLREAKTSFIKYKVDRRGSTNTTAITYRSILREFIGYVDGCIGDLTLEIIDTFIDQLSTRNYKPKTFKNKIVVIRSFIRYLYSKNLTDIRPESIEIPKVVDMEANFLDYDQQDKLVEACQTLRDKAIVLTLIRSGLRVSELLEMRTDDLFERSIVVRRGKGGKPRVTFIDQQTEDAIKQYLESKRRTLYLFTNHFGDKLSRQYVARIVSLYGELAGIEVRVTPHTLRHTFATNLLRAGARIEDVQPMMGHASIATTRAYMHFTNDYLHKRYDEIMEKAIDISASI